MEVVKEGGEKIRAKLENRGVEAIFVGYSENHPEGTYHFINRATRKAIHSRDVTWLNMTYGEFKKTRSEHQVKIQQEQKFIDTYFEEMTMNDGSVEEPVVNDVVVEVGNEVAVVEVEEDENNESQQVGVITRSSAKKNDADTPVNRGRTRSERLFNNIVQYDQVMMSIDVDEYEEFDDPINFNEAWNHSDEEMKVKWRDSIMKDMYDFKKRDVWSIVKNEGQRTIGLRWVFQKKKDGRCRSRIVALGYLQRAGVDFTEIHSPYYTKWHCGSSLWC